MNASPAARALESAVRETAAALAPLPRPSALFLCATGASMIAERLEGARALALDGPRVPAPWRGAELLAGRLGDLVLWALDGAGAAPDDAPRWSGGFPCWLAASAGAAVLVLATAGTGLAERDPGVPRGTLALLSDHLRFGDANPLVGLGECELGPLFPDLTRLHDVRLRRAARERAQELGIRVAEAVAACTPGPGLETPAERRMLARLGADVVVQGASAPLIAAAHAGLGALVVAAVTDEGAGPARVEEILAASEELAPSLEDLLVHLAPDVRARAAELAREHGA